MKSTYLEGLKMFKHIDPQLIGYTQWIVRQIELFTKITRDDLIRSFLKLLFLVSFLIPISTLILTANDSELMAVILTAPLMGVSVGMRFLAAQIKVAFENQKNEGALPGEIFSRRDSRQIMIFFVLFCGILSLISKLLILIQLSYLLFAAGEYLLCTTSLPPGEKERGKGSKEELALQGAQG